MMHIHACNMIDSVPLLTLTSSCHHTGSLTGGALSTTEQTSGKRKMIKRSLYVYNMFLSAGLFRSVQYPAITLDELVSRVGINKEQLNKECSNNHLQRISPLLLDWLSYAKNLGLSDSQTQDITDNSQLLTHAMKVLTVLEKWHQQHAFNATYHHLVTVCLNLGHVTIATDICNILKAGLSHSMCVE